MPRRDLLVRCVRFAHDDILADGTGLEPGVLQHHAVGRAQTAARQLADILAAHADTAAVHIVEAHEQIDDRRLAAAGRPDDGNTLAGLRGKIKMLDQVLLRDIGERDVLQRNTAVGVRERLRIGGLRGLRRFSMSSKMRSAQASAFCSSVTTPEISLKGFVYCWHS